jgi:predicted alpha/beta hydrolase family esterase
MSEPSLLPRSGDALRAYQAALEGLTREPKPDLGPRVERWTMVDARGETFTALWRAARPEQAPGEQEPGRPWTVVLLGGFYSGDRAALLLPDLRTYVLAVDWPWDGERRLKVGQFVRAMPAIRRTLMRSPAALALGVEAVARQPEVDSGRIALVGASLGVPSTVATLALTPAPTAGVLLYGGADIRAWMHHEVNRRRLAPRGTASAVASFVFQFVRPLEPSLHQGAAPRRMLIVNSHEDQCVPRPVAEALHRTFPDAEVRWKTGVHLVNTAGAMLDGVSAEVEDWLRSAKH